MSSLVFPSLPGLVNGITREIIEDTRIETTPSGREYRSSWRITPTYRYRLAFEWLRADAAEFQQLAGFFARMRGQWDSFLFQDPEDCAVTAHPFGVGNGTTTVFYLQRSLVPSPFLAAAGSRSYWPLVSDGYEPCQDLASAPTIYVNGVAKTGGGVDYTLGNDGKITFTAAPANGLVLTWDGTYWKRVRFDGSLSKTRIVQSLWSVPSIDLVSVPGGGGVTYTAPPAGVVFTPTAQPTWLLDSGLLY
jgi:hypothetical protein